MDVIYPKIEEVNGVPYRINPYKDYDFMKQAETTPYVEYGDEDAVECNREIIEEEDSDIDVQILDNGRFQILYHVAKPFFSYIIGRKGSTKQQLEQQTRTVIYVPRQNETGNLVITGSNRDGVLAAYRRIKIMITTCRSKHPKTHFLSLPMNQPEFIKNYLRFRNMVLEKCSNQGITPELFQFPEKLHQTIGVLVLLDNEERNIAVDALMQSKSLIIDPILKKHSIKIHVRGIEYMNDDPSKVNILFGKIEPNSSLAVLQQLVDHLADFFNTTDLMVNHRGQVKLHITLMNTLFLKSDPSNEDRYSNNNKTFDATQIMEVFKDYDFGEVEINNIHLSQFHTSSNDGYYAATCKITCF